MKKKNVYEGCGGIEGWEGLGQKVSLETQSALKKIDDAIRYAAASAHQIFVD
jgi:hypothetical protein